jgi:glycosyltransferase involved in cell wall biosynthesis
MSTDFSASLKEAVPWRVMHLLRPAEGGMRAQAAALIQDAPQGSTLLAAPSEVLRFIGDRIMPTFSLPEKIGGLKQQVKAGWSAGEWARRHQVTVLHAHGLRWLPLYAVAAFRARLPLVITLHNIVPPPGTMTLRERLAITLGLGQAARIIAVSAAVAESVSLVVPGISNRLQVIRNGIDLSRFPSPLDPSRRASTRAALRLPEDAFVVICVARLAPEKNLGILLEAMARLVSSSFKLPKLHLLLVGDGPWRPTLEHQVRMLRLPERVTFAGTRTDIPELLEASDLFCLPSRTEGLGIAVIEAMAAGLPAVVSRVGGLPEVVEDGVTGLLVAPEDCLALAEALATILVNKDQAKQMGASGRLRAIECFNNQAMIAETFAVYNAVTASRKSN